MWRGRGVWWTKAARLAVGLRKQEKWAQNGGGTELP